MPALAARQTVLGVVLAGGQSRRMFEGTQSGGDKGLLNIGGRPMLGHVIERLRPQVADVILNANGDPGRFAAFGLQVVPDTIEGYVGPLAGILAGMSWARAHRPDIAWIASVSADAPLLPADLVDGLVRGLGERVGAIAIAQSGGEMHPVIGLWPVALAQDLETALEQGVRKVLAWTDRHGTVGVEFPPLLVGDRSIDPFFNANTPAEIAELRKILEQSRRAEAGL